MLLVELGVILILVLLNAVFAGAEIAVISARQPRLMQLAAEGSRRARAVLELRGHPERFFATVQVGISVVGATAGAFGGAAFAEDLEPVLARWPPIAEYAETVSVLIVVILLSYLSIVVGELVPKSLALKHSESYSLLISKPLLVLSSIARPVIWLLSKSSNLVLRPFGDSTSFTERALELEGLTAKDVMIPRERIDAIPAGSSLEQLQQILLERGHTRMPVFRGTLDDIVGELMVKDVLALIWEQKLIILQDVLRPPFRVREDMLARRVLSELKRHRTEMAIVVDAQDRVVGLLTVRDILEEMVVDLLDEGSV